MVVKCKYYENDESVWNSKENEYKKYVFHGSFGQCFLLIVVLFCLCNLLSVVW